MNTPRAIIFDLDDTLAESFKRPSDEMLDKLRQLLEHIPVAIMTGAGFPRMEAQFLPALTGTQHIERFYLFPTSTSECYVFRDGAWQKLYSILLTEEERTRIKTAITEIVATSNVLSAVPNFGQQMIDRGAQVAFTLVGIDAPKEIKDTWDADGAKRRLLKNELEKVVPEFEVLLGGKTTVDVTRKGINKSYGIRWLSEQLDIPANEMLYVGDAFFEGGNDAIVIQTGIAIKAVSGPSETPAVIDEVLAAF